jgi:hypothetical protein
VLVDEELSPGEGGGIGGSGVLCLDKLSMFRKGVAETRKGAHVLSEEVRWRAVVGFGVRFVWEVAGATTVMSLPLSIGGLGLALMITSY